MDALKVPVASVEQTAEKLGDDVKKLWNFFIKEFADAKISDEASGELPSPDGEKEHAGALMRQLERFESRVRTCIGALKPGAHFCCLGDEMEGDDGLILLQGLFSPYENSPAYLPKDERFRMALLYKIIEIYFIPTCIKNRDDAVDSQIDKLLKRLIKMYDLPEESGLIMLKTHFAAKEAARTDAQ